MEGFKTEADHKSAGDGDWSTEPSAAFDESAEAESHQQELEAAVRSDGGDGLLHDFKLAGFYGNVVEEDGGDHNPDNFQKPVRRAVRETTQCHRRGHVEHHNSAEERGGCAGYRAKVGLHLEACQ